MISKRLLAKRLSTAIGKELSQPEFAHFFAYFCERKKRPDLRTLKNLEEEDVEIFSRFCGYDLRFPIPLPLWEKL
jgi:hypothetical protein